jgi:hypothetical protein
MLKKIPVIVVITAILTVLPVLVPPCTPVYAAEPESECWAVMVGVSHYKSPKIGDATGCAENAEDLFQRLSPTWGNDHIKLLLDSEASKSDVRAAVDWLVSSEGANDTVLFYFSGHGDPDGYLGPYDAYYARTWISSRELSSWLSPLESERVVIILDTCYAGKYERELSESGRVVLLSSRADEYSYSSSWGEYSTFTYYLLEALDEFSVADANLNYELSAEELFRYAEPETIEENTDIYVGGEFQAGEMQHPVLSDDYSGELSLLLKFIFNTDPGLPSGNEILVLDNKTYSSTPPELIWAPGSVHDLTVLASVDSGSGTRYVFTSWNDGDTSVSRTVSKGGVYTANYKAQHELTIESAYSAPEGEGWYDAGSTATISVTSIEEPTTRHIFTGWSGDFSGAAEVASVTMDSPKAIRANWRTDYLLAIESTYGEPEGEGWYESGSTVTISVTPSEGMLIRHIFTGWSGDFSGDAATASVTVDSPKVITANWRTDRTRLYILIGIIVLIAAISGGLRMRRRKQAV